LNTSFQKLQTKAKAKEEGLLKKNKKGLKLKLIFNYQTSVVLPRDTDMSLHSKS